MIKTFTELEEQALKQDKKKIVLAMAEEENALTAAVKAAEKNIVDPVLIGSKDEIQKIADHHGFDISSFESENISGSDRCAERAVELVRSGSADLLMKGKVPTSVIMKAALNKEKGIRKSAVMSHVTIIETPFYHKFLIMSDPGLNIAPDINAKAGIITNAVDACRKLGVEKPKVAIVGAVEKVNEAMPATLDAAILCKMADRGQIENCIIDGPFALDNAISKKSCEIKGINTDVGGDADIVIMPDIEAANVFYKVFAYLTDVKMAGVIMGAASPIILPSRSDSDSVKYLSILTGISLA